MHSSESVAHIAPAFVEAQAAFEAISKDADNPYFNSKYADITSILGMIRPVLAQHGLAVMQHLMPCDTGVQIKTVLLHSSGEWIEDDGLHVPAAKQDPQGYGSAITYTRRYAMLAFFALATEDDDANSATAAMSKVELARMRAQQK